MGNDNMYLGYLRHIQHEIENVLPLLDMEGNSRRSGTAEKYQVINLRANLSLLRIELIDFIKEEQLYEESQDNSHLST